MERKQTITISLDERTVEIARQMAEAENRTISNYIETVLKREQERAEQ